MTPTEIEVCKHTRSGHATTACREWLGRVDTIDDVLISFGTGVVGGADVSTWQVNPSQLAPTVALKSLLEAKRAIVVCNLAADIRIAELVSIGWVERLGTCGAHMEVLGGYGMRVVDDDGDATLLIGCANENLNDFSGFTVWTGIRVGLLFGGLPGASRSSARARGASAGSLCAQSISISVGA